MASSTFSGPIKAGDVREGAFANVGSVEMVQTAEIAVDATLVQSATMYVPANSEIIDIYVLGQEAYDSATSAGLTVGKTAAGTDFLASVNVKNTGIQRATLTTAQAVLWRNVTTNTKIVATVTSVGQPTTGKVTVVVKYRQR